jgi:hypothetical protein
MKIYKNAVDLKKQFLSLIQSQFADLKAQEMESKVADNLLSPFVIELPQEALTQAQFFAKEIFKLRNSPNYQQELRAEFITHGLREPKNYSIMMSYDFHWTGTQLKLIEVNTNAAFIALGDLMYQAHEISQPVADFSIKEISQNILQEVALDQQMDPAQVLSSSKSFNVAIVDDHPEQQRLFIEFLVFNELFKSWGWNSKICDIRESLQNLNFIYNRNTDFFLESPEVKNLKDYWLEQSQTLSPNPWEYHLLADKERMIQWWDPEFQAKVNMSEELKKVIEAFVPVSRDVKKSDPQVIWADRKNLFFKPKRAFGSKQSYKGHSLSKKVFDEILAGDFIAQEYVNAPEKIFETPEGPQAFKYDLRFYAYQDRIQSVVARLYQGQVTNLRTPLGGFSPVRFI